MIPEALELYVEVSHSWCICVVSHGYGGLGWGRDGGDGWYACGTHDDCKLGDTEHYLRAR